MSFANSFVALLFLICLAASAPAQVVVPSDEKSKKVTELTATQKEFTNLPEQQRRDFFKHINEAERLFNQKRIFECMSEVRESSKIFNKSSEVFNLLGSCYVEFRDFDKARELFSKANQISPNQASILFNIGEMEFVTHNWKSCLEKMNQTIKLLPKQDVITRRLVEFKIMLCHIALGDQEEANKMAERYDPLEDDSPYYYYAQASLCYRDKEIVKAEEWYQIANRVYQNSGMLSAWQDTLIEFGYIASFYGGNPDAEK
jgi:tetratricopeptide (TPR) repeat protein